MQKNKIHIICDVESETKIQVSEMTSKSSHFRQKVRQAYLKILCTFAVCFLAAYVVGQLAGYSIYMYSMLGCVFGWWVHVLARLVIAWL
jgi:hypothetical protein